MSQNDFNIANQGFPATRADINSALQALASNSAGTSEPSTTYAYQFWYDETNELLKMRNSDNDAWITLAAFDQATDEWEVRTAVVQAVDSAGVVIKTDDGTTRITVADNGNVTIANNLTVSGNIDVSSGTIKLDGNYPVGTGNVALGDTALDSNVSGASNTAIGAEALQANTTASQNTAVGYHALYANTGAENTALGYYSLRNATTGARNTAVGRFAAGNAAVTGSDIVAVGYNALLSNTSGNSNVAIGSQALQANTTANANTAVGYQSLYSNTTGSVHVALGYGALRSNTTGAQNVAVGFETMYANTTGGFNVGIGREALYSNTTASNNTAVGYQAGYSTVANGSNVFVGYQAGYASTGANNTVVGYYAGGEGNIGSSNALFGTAAGQKSTGQQNTFIGHDAGWQITTGAKNTILGRYNGNQGGLDIRTSSNNIVLSDGDGNPRLYIDGSGRLLVNGTSVISGRDERLQVFGLPGSYAAIATSMSATTGQDHITFHNPNGVVGAIQTSGSSTTYATSSDYRLKENVVELTGATERLKQLNPSRFNFIADADTTVDGFIAHEVQSVVPEAVTGTKDEVDADGNPVYQGIDQSKLVPLLVATIKELEARIAALESA